MEQKFPFCPVETTLTLIGDKWKVIIIRDLLEGTKRFGELKRTVGKVTQKVLTANLRDMEEMGLVTRTVYAEVPPRVEYTLTDIGYSLKPILDVMTTWGVEYKKKNGCSLNAEILGSNQDIAHVQSRLVMIDDISSALELMNTVKYETACSKIIAHQSNFSESFFKLSTKLAEEIKEKYTSYNVKIAIVGDFSVLTSKSFQEFMISCAEEGFLFFVPTVDEAVRKLEL